MAADTLKQKAAEAIDKYAADLHRLNQKIWANPELCYEERDAHELLCGFLEGHGFTVERNHGGIATAFRASGKPCATGLKVGFICEYDALPEIGHACGHNLIAELGAAAGLGE